MKIGDTVIAPEGCAEYLTPNKEYLVVKLWDINFPLHRGCGFYIIDDTGHRLACNEKKSSHLGRQDWVIKNVVK